MQVIRCCLFGFPGTCVTIAQGLAAADTCWVVVVLLRRSMCCLGVMPGGTLVSGGSKVAMQGCGCATAQSGFQLQPVVHGRIPLHGVSIVCAVCIHCLTATISKHRGLPAKTIWLKSHIVYQLSVTPAGTDKGCACRALLCRQPAPAPTSACAPAAWRRWGGSQSTPSQRWVL